MAYFANSPFVVSSGSLSLANYNQVQLLKLQKLLNGNTSPKVAIKHLTVSCTNRSPWEPAPISFAPSDEAEGKFLNKTENIFEAMDSSDRDEAEIKHVEQISGTSNQQTVQFHYLRWPVWLLGPALLLVTGMVPTLWLPVSSVFLGPNIASLLSLTGLDCIFNLGAFLFLLLADSCACPENTSQGCQSRPPFSYQLWNMVSNIVGFIIPVVMLFSSQKGILAPFLPFISFSVLMGPYLLLLSVQILTEMLTWHWKSPVWLVTPIVYEAYRLLQLMRGLKLAAEITAPSWMLHTIRGLVCWWVLVLGMQLMRVAWYAGLTARDHQPESSAVTDGN